MNLNFAQQSIDWLKALGVEEILVCAGARNAPLVYALTETKNETFKLRYFFEERSAGFFALGRIAATDKPVAVVTTSGTAVAELLPAVIEAYYQCRPLIVVSADRPASYRDTGAPQSIEQVGLFGRYVEACLDLAASPQLLDFPLKEFSFKRPLHLNLCFTEPLLSKADESRQAWPVPKTKNIDYRYSGAGTSPHRNFKNPLVVVSELPAEWQAWVEEYLAEQGWECYLEAPSGVCGQWLNLIESEPYIRKCLPEKRWDHVIRIGGVPTARWWRDLEDLKISIQSFSHRNFSGLSHVEAKVYPLVALDELRGQAVKEVKPAQKSSHRVKLEKLFDQYPHSEPGWFYKISQLLPEGSLLYLGNSLPIREWDLVTDKRKKNLVPYAHRGANGIDGQISGFLGRCESSRPNFAILGDLTTLYDLSGFWAWSKELAPQVQVIVINNGGGKIFDRMFDRPEFQNRHSLNFSHAAKLWNWSYQKVERAENWDLDLSPCLIEIVPDEVQTQEFWQAFEKFES